MKVIQRYIKGLTQSNTRRYRMTRVRIALWLSPLLTARQLRAISGVPTIAGAATNEVFKPGNNLVLVCSHPAAPASGDPVRIGKMTGVAVLNEGEGGVAATETVVDVGSGVYDILVDDNGGTGIAVGDPLFYHDTGTGTPATSVNNSPTAADAFFGYALEPVSANATTTIRVKHVLQEL